MTVLSKDFLQNIGLRLSDDEYTAFADHAETTLRERVIEEILSSITPEQAHELAQLQHENDEVRIQEWLTANVKDLAEIISDEIDILLGEVAEQADELSSR